MYIKVKDRKFVEKLKNINKLQMTKSLEKFLSKNTKDTNAIIGEKIGNGMKLYCTHCKTYHDINYHLKIKDNFKCPNCKNVFPYIRKKYSHRSPSCYFDFSIVEKLDNKLICRYFEVRKQMIYNGFDYNYNILEYNRISNECYYYLYYNKMYSSRWNVTKKDKTHYSYGYYGYYNSAYDNKEIYCHNYSKGLKTLLANTKYKYSALELINCKVNVFGYLDRTLAYKECELLAKNGFPKLAANYSNSKSDNENVQYMLKNMRYKFELLRKLDVDYEDIYLVDCMNIKSKKELLIYKEKQFTYKFVVDFINKYGRKNKLHNFILNSDVMRDVDYKDYIEWCKKLSYDLKFNKVLFPINFKSEHDRLMKMVEDVNNAGINKKINERSFELLPYVFSKNNFVILPVENFGDLIYESQELKHCVRTYAERIANGMTNIMFIRNTKEITKPLATLEFRGNQVIQCRGYDNNASNPLSSSIKQFVNLWCKDKKLKSCFKGEQSWN